MSAPAFRFVQFEYGQDLGPADGRYVVRARPDEEPRLVVVLTTVFGARGRPRRVRRARTAEPSPAPTARATLIDPAPLPSAEAAQRWLSELRSDRQRLDARIAEAARDLNAVLRAHRAAAADPWTPELSAAGALSARIGHGRGEQLADGRFEEAYEVPAERRSRRGELLVPQERLARILGGHEVAATSEELVLRAQADLAARRPREAALQARIALEALLGELDQAQGAAAEDRRRLSEARAGVSEAANAALAGDPPEAARARVEEAVEAMAAAVRRRALGG